MIVWTKLNGTPGAMPDEPGRYLCAFADGTVETFDIEYDDIENGGWGYGGAKMLYWTDVPEHPDLHNWISWNENEHYGEQHGHR